MDSNHSRSLVLRLGQELTTVPAANTRILAEMVESSLELARMSSPERVDLDALVREGKLIQKGEGMTPENIQAFKLFYQAATAGHSEAQFLVCDCYECGRGTMRDKRQYQSWLRKSAELGFAAAQNRLGWETKDCIEGAAWFRLAAEQNFAKGQFNLGKRYSYGAGVVQDKAEAARWYMKAALQGHDGAQYELGVLYQRGQTLEQNDEEAAKWWIRAANQGNSRAQYELGICYANGLGVPQNDQEAFKWWRKSVMQGGCGLFELGNCYSQGRGTPRDVVEAYAWLRLVAEVGRTEAIAQAAALEDLMTAREIKSAFILCCEYEKIGLPDWFLSGLPERKRVPLKESP